MSDKRHIADAEMARAASICPNVIKVTIDKPCHKCGRVMMIPAGGICIPCSQDK